MSRPALSAARTMEILDLLAAFPGRAFTMSEVIRATGINIASCHAVLSALTQHGYLTRHDNDKTYVLGPALLSVGQATLHAQPLAVRAQKAAAELFDELSVPVLLSTIAGHDILALASISPKVGRGPGMRVGQRIPLVPPNGAHFLAWAAEPAIAEWIARSDTQDETEIASWRHALALVRKRGFQVTLRSTQSTEFATLMAEMAAGHQPLDYRSQATSIMSDHGWALAQPETIEPETLYDVVLIAAPIFDRDGRANLSLGLAAFPDKLTGRQIETYAAQLMNTCLRIMREARAT